MAYIGQSPSVGAYKVCDAISTSATDTFNLLVGGVATIPETANNCIVSLNGVIQAPTLAFTVSGSTIVFASALTTADVIDFIYILGDVMSIGTPSDDTVGAAQIKDDLISGTTALASEPADTDEFLVSDAGTLKRIDYSLIKGGGITAADTWRLTTNFTDVANPIASNWEQTDTGGQSALGSSMSQSSGIFTFPSTGFWLVQFAAKHLNSSDADYHKDLIEVTTNNSSYAAVTELWGNLEPSEYNTTFGMAIIDVTSTTNVKVRFSVATADTAANMTTYGDTDINTTYATFTRLGDT